MSAATYAPAAAFGTTMIVAIIVVARVFVSDLLRRVECGTGV